MKKNLMSVLILALVFANFVLTAILMFTVLPQTQKANKLIEAVCSAAILELNSGAATGTSNVPIKQIEVFELIPETDALMFNFASSGDGKSHYGVLAISLSLNKESEGYKEYGPTTLTANKTMMKDTVNQIVRSYTIEEFNNNQDEVKEAILEEFQNTYGKDFIVGINFSKVQAE